MSRLAAAVQQLQSARQYTVSLLQQTKTEDWRRQPSEGVTHIAWQVGHLAVAEYRLILERTRGRIPADSSLISDEFMARYGRGSTPEAPPANRDAPEAIRSVFDRVHEQALAELSHLPEEEWDMPPLVPHRRFDTKLGAVWFCSLHEMLHAGQIGLLRRLLGYGYSV